VKEFTLFAASHYATSTAPYSAPVAFEDELQTHSRSSSRGQAARRPSDFARAPSTTSRCSNKRLCAGIENYSAHLDGRKPGERPTRCSTTSGDYLVVIDESHVAVPRCASVRGRPLPKRDAGRARVRLPCALDNRPLNFDEFMELVPRCLRLRPRGPSRWSTATRSSNR